MVLVYLEPNAKPDLVALPFFLIARNLKLLDTPWALILIYLTFNVPIVVWICADHSAIFRRNWTRPRRSRATTPLGSSGDRTPAGDASASRLSDIQFYLLLDELLYALILTRSEAKTAPVVATSFMSGYELPWGQIMATGTLVALPVIVFSMIVSRQFVRGLTAGAIK